MQYVFAFDAKDYPALKKVLEADAFDENSFSRVGFVLKSSESLSGVPPGQYFVFFEADEARAKGLVEKLEATKCCSVVPAELKKNVIDQILAEQDRAASGFGSLFG